MHVLRSYERKLSGPAVPAKIEPRVAVPCMHDGSRKASSAPPQVEELQFKQHFPYFCCFASFTCCIVFFVELGANGGFQPFACPTTGRIGMPAYDDGTPCEPNVMLGPSISAMDQLGAKNDLAIFERGEWWRLIICNWLHSGIFLGPQYGWAVLPWCAT